MHKEVSQFGPGRAKGSPSAALLSEAALGKAIGEFKQKQDFRGLSGFLGAQVKEITRAQGPSTLLSRLNNELALSLLEQEEVARAKEYLDKAVALDPENRNAAYNRANISFYMKDFKDALERYGSLLNKAPRHVGATYNAALCHALSGRVSEALPLFKRVMELEPGYAGAHFWAGECLLDSGKPEEALACFREAAELNPDHPESVRGLAICLFHAGEFEAALSLCDGLLDRTGPELTALRVKGDALLALGRPVEAARCHIHMAVIDFDAREFLVHRAKFLMEKEPEKAAAYIEHVLEHFPEFAGSLGQGRKESA